MADFRKVAITHETTNVEAGRALDQPITKAVAMAIVQNPCAGRFVDDLMPLYEIGRAFGEALIDDLVARLPHPAVSYGKGAIVGVDGEQEHGHACVHPMLGKPMRGAIGGGTALIPATVIIGGPGSSLDMPLGHKDNVWSFDHFDTVTAGIADGPRPDELLLVMGLADGARPFPRCGDGPIA